MQRKYPSGAQKRASALEKKVRTLEGQRTLPRISCQNLCNKIIKSSQSHAIEEDVQVETSSLSLETEITIAEQPAAQEVVSKALNVANDIGLWPKVLSEDLRDYWIKRGSSSCQHRDGDFRESGLLLGSQRRYCTATLFTRVHTRTGESFERNWLCYSKTRSCVYCFTCKVMPCTVSKLTSGCNDWKHAHEILSSHENPKQHLDAMATLCGRRGFGQIDNGLVELKTCSKKRKKNGC